MSSKKMDAADRTIKTALNKHELNNIDISKVFKDPINLKIQTLFDSVYKASKSKPQKNDDEYSLDNLFGDTNETQVLDSDEKSSPLEEAPSPTLVFNSDELTDSSLLQKESEMTSSEEFSVDEGFSVEKEDASELNFSDNNESQGDIGLNLGESSDEELNFDGPSAIEASSSSSESDDGLGIDFSASDSEELEFDETSKISQKKEEVKSVEEDLSSFSLEEAAEENDKTGENLNFDESIGSNDFITSEDSRKNIESTISSIIKPNVEKTDEFKNLLKDPESTNEKILIAAVQAEREDSGEDLNFEDVPPDVPTKTAENTKLHTHVDNQSLYNNLNTEDAMRFQSTIRQLREEREELLGQIKFNKGQLREAEQDNLSLKAAYDEVKIELAILRKKQNLELEDLKYRLSINEEKRLLIEEKYRQSEKQKEKLEQKVRIDYNQVKMREKELESKLELMSMDIDSQLKSRDSKILELRRKIDSLEFNMENAAIKEQKSQDDKRKVEEKLNKIMKTLRNSIESLEESIDESTHEKDLDK